MFDKEDRSTFSYWFAHWCAFQMTALNCKAWKIKYLFHDCEKPWLKLFLPYHKVQELHRSHNKHHPEWLERQLSQCRWTVDKLLDKFDYNATIIDWECSHYTKSQCKLNAYGEYRKLMSYDGFKEKYPLIARYCYNEFSVRLMNSIKKLRLEG